MSINQIDIDKAVSDLNNTKVKVAFSNTTKAAKTVAPAAPVRQQQAPVKQQTVPVMQQAPVKQQTVPVMQQAPQVGNGAVSSSKLTYSVIGRYASGSSIIAYRLMCNETRKSYRFTKAACIYLIDRKRITNMTSQFTNGDMLFRGVGIKLEDLPTAQVKKEDNNMVVSSVRNAGTLNRAQSKTSASMQMEMLMYVRTIKDGKSASQYEFLTRGGQTITYSPAETRNLLRHNMVVNLRLNKSGDKEIIRKTSGKF